MPGKKLGVYAVSLALVALLATATIFWLARPETPQWPQDYAPVDVFRDDGPLEQWRLWVSSIFTGSRAVVTSEGNPIHVATLEGYAHTFPRIGKSLKVDLVILNASYERALNPALAADAAPMHSLAQTRIVLVSPAEKAGQLFSASGASLQWILERARRGELQLLQHHEKYTYMGVPMLVLEGYALGAITPDGNSVAAASRDNLLQWLPETAMFYRYIWDDSVTAMRWDVALMTEADCATLRRRGYAVQAVYPREGTLLLDYPAFVPSWVSGERREAAQMFLEALKSEDMQALQNMFPINDKCVGVDAEPKIVDPPAPNVLRDVVDNWRPRLPD
jgi:hypothetical protein